MVELKILVIILGHDHAVVVDWAKNWLESVVAEIESKNLVAIIIGSKLQLCNIQEALFFQFNLMDK